MTGGTFAVESFVDELAANAKQGPLAYRVALLDKNPRAKAVLQIAAELSGWGKPLPAGQGRGIALCIGFGSFIAQVVQVSIDKEGAVNPTRVWCAVDCGVKVNPDTIGAQMESVSSSACWPRAAAPISEVPFALSQISRGVHTPAKLFRCVIAKSMIIFANVSIDAAADNPQIPGSSPGQRANSFK